MKRLFKNQSVQFILIAICLSGFNCYGQPSNKTKIDKPEIRFYGVKILVTDLDKAVDFYGNKMGFTVKANSLELKEVMLQSTSLTIKLGLAKINNSTDYSTEAHAKVAFQVNQLLSTFQYMKDKGVTFYEDELSRNGIGIGLPFSDPFGNKHTLAEVQIRQIQPFKEPSIYNMGFNVPNIEVAKNFYTEIMGFEVYSSNYLPSALPLKHSDGSFAFMLHYKNETHSASTEYPQESQSILLFTTDDLETAIRYLKEKQVNLLFSKPKKCLEGNFIAFRDNHNNVSELIQLNLNQN